MNNNTYIVIGRKKRILPRILPVIKVIEENLELETKTENETVETENNEIVEEQVEQEDTTQKQEQEPKNSKPLTFVEKRILEIQQRLEKSKLQNPPIVPTSKPSCGCGGGSRK